MKKIKFMIILNVLLSVTFFANARYNFYRDDNSTNNRRNIRRRYNRNIRRTRRPLRQRRPNVARANFSKVKIRNLTGLSIFIKIYYRKGNVFLNKKGILIPGASTVVYSNRYSKIRIFYTVGGVNKLREVTPNENYISVSLHR